jgi:vacuolar-type H+-ATPase catalytic subunit A/Vma1
MPFRALIMGNVFDGIQRPLEEIYNQVKNIYIPRGINVSSLDESKSWEFKPVPEFKVGTHISGGDIFGYVQENNLIKHAIMLPPESMGTVSFIIDREGKVAQKIVGVTDKRSLETEIQPLLGTAHTAR